jgi:alpha-L-arabinofuranosidase
MKIYKVLLMSLAFAASTVFAQEVHRFDIDTHKVTAAVPSTMYGAFFEDINFGADGGLYAEMVENRSFEFPDHLMGWNTFGNVEVRDDKPAFPKNPHYVRLTDVGHNQKFTGIENHGFFGMGIKKGMKYDFTVYGRLTAAQGKNGKIRVELVDSSDNVITKDEFSIVTPQWQKYSLTLTSPVTDAKAFLRIYLGSTDGVDLDYVSLFPEDSWHGLRGDLVKALEDLHPGVFRFPGGCIVEGTDLATRYQWKNSVGEVEERPLNENRWNYTFTSRLFPNYFQSYGLGFYEYFLLAEKIGAEPLPVLNCGMACQYQNNDDDANAHVAVADLQPYVQDALDLIEFANGSVSTKWGKLRADMGHLQPFNLKLLAVGNEQWGKLYPERLEVFVKAIRKQYPYIRIVGSAGPDSEGEKFDYAWPEMRRIGVDLVDEHYYRNPQWFLSHANRYDSYDRKGPKVFAGEYACHIDGKNSFMSALCEAAFMTGLERNADVVNMATYAPLFAHVDGWQWRPDLIWFDNLRSVRSVNYYVQQLYSLNKGTNVLSLTCGGKAVEGQDGLYATAVWDKNRKVYICKIVNVADKEQTLKIVLNGVKKLSGGTVTIMHSDNKDAENTLDNPQNVIPNTTNLSVTGNELNVTIGAKTFAVYVLNK